MRFHGKLTRGWVLGRTDDVPTKLLPVMRRVSPVPFFDGGMLDLARWMSARYVAPLASVLERLTPPRVAEEEVRWLDDRATRAVARQTTRPPSEAPELLPGYRGGKDLREALRDGDGTFVVRPAVTDEVALVVEAVERCLEGGRAALVLVPYASPQPATAEALSSAFGDRVCLFAGGDRRTRYRTWLEILDRRYDVVVGTRPAVFAPLERLGLVYVSRESHPAHREDRAPYFHARDVAMRRAAATGAVCVLAALCSSGEAAALEAPHVTPTARRWPRVEVVRPGTEGRAPRLIEALRGTRRGFVLAPVPGYGVAQACRACGAPAGCPSCGGVLRLEEGQVRCAVCNGPGRCRSCGATDFGIRRGGRERVEEWIARLAPVPVKHPGRPRPPASRGEILVGGAEDVRDLGPQELDLVAILDADSTVARPGLAARERAASVWMDAASWAGPDGRVIVQASKAGDPAVQALVRGNPTRLHEQERQRRVEVGFPVGSAVFRVVGTTALAEEAKRLGASTSLVTSLGGRTVCLLAFELERVPAFGDRMRALAAAGVVERVEAEPHL